MQMGKLATKIKVSKAADFPIPKKISVADFTELCTIHDLPLDQKTYVRERLDELVTAFSNHMREKKRQPHPRTDRERVSDAQSLIRKGIAKLEKVGPQGLLALEAVASTVSPMLSARWLSERFPDDNYAPRPNTLPMEGRFGSRSPEHGQEFFIEEQTQEARYEFVRSRPKKLRWLCSGIWMTHWVAHYLDSNNSPDPREVESRFWTDTLEEPWQASDDDP
jgi:hypothetical protein